MQQFTGTLDKRDVKQHIPHIFTIPAGTTQLEIRFDYTPAYVNGMLNALHLSLFDPQGCRGAGHRRGDVREDGVTHTILINAIQATPGYRAGPLQPGQWSLVIDTHMILAGQPVPYQIQVHVSNDAVAIPDDLPVRQPQPPQRGPGWYRGDLHGHTVHSDGSWQIADLLDSARAFKLDFVTLSDHNTVAPLAEFISMAQPDLLTIGGIELTTYYGHALALGIHDWVDWRVRPSERTMPQIATEVAAAGGTFIIAHPMSVGDPICTGCDWSYADMMPGPARFVEIWNGGIWESESGNEAALALWYSWLNQGHHLVATAGTDVHGPPPAGVQPGFNIVYAEALSEAAILQAISLGHLYLSDGPQIEFTAQSADGTSAMIGERLHADRVTINASWQATEQGDQIRLIANGQVLVAQPAHEHGQKQWQLDVAQPHWYVLEVRNLIGHLRAVTNPIFVGL
jgi:hypothetical protein